MKYRIQYIDVFVLMAILTFMYYPRASENEKLYIAQEIQGISDARLGIGILYDRCQKEKSFLLSPNDNGTLGYKCEGKYPKKLSLTYENVLTNDISADNGYPLILVSYNLQAEHWKTKSLKDGRVIIKGPASLTLTQGAINNKNYWLYDPKDGSISFYDDKKLKKSDPLL